MPVIAVAENHGVDVAIPESGEHVHPFGGNDLRIRRNRQRTDLADGGDAFAVDQDDAIGEGRPSKAVDQSPADQSRQASGGGQRDGAGQSNKAKKNLDASHGRDCRRR